VNVRARDIILVLVALAVVAGVAAAGYAVVSARTRGASAPRQALAPVPMPTVAASSSPGATPTPEPQYERWTVGVARRPVTVYRRPDASAPVVQRLGKTAVANYPTLFLVDIIRQVDGAPWYKVRVPAPPNGTEGWVPDGQLAFYTTTSKIEIDLSKRTLTVYRRGESQGSWPVAVGRPGLSTPTGTFFVTLKLRPSDPGGPYGVLALGTSAYQAKLSGWAGGGIVAIHGTNEPWLIGQAISHGCVRMKNSAIVKVSRLVPAGSPIFISK
jgi:lipoprotein-anchoring transpeptidase ErfK/SrfK